MSFSHISPVYFHQLFIQKVSFLYLRPRVVQLPSKSGQSLHKFPARRALQSAVRHAVKSIFHVAVRF